MAAEKTSDIIARAEMTHELTADEIAGVLGDASTEDELAAAADRVRKRYVGDEVHLRGIIEFSNICRRDCCYCGLRADNGRIDRYRMKPEEILRLAERAKSYGYRTLVLQSGEDETYSKDVLVPLIRAISSMDMAVTLSLGERSFEEYKAFREAGADRYLLRIETTDKALYQKYDPGMSWENRDRCLRDLKALGYEVGTGNLIGLPGQTLLSIAKDILYFKEIDADMIGLGPLVPNGDTPLGEAAPGDLHLVRRVVAMVRLMIPDANIPATTAVETLKPGGRVWFLGSGCNVVMPNVTEGAARAKYALYPGKICINDTPAACRSCMSGQIRAIGRSIASDKGSRRHTYRRGERKDA